MVRHALPTFPASLSPATAARSTRFPLPSLQPPLLVQLVSRFPLSHRRYPLHSFTAPHSPGSERERHAHSAHFAPAKPIAVFWMIRQNAIALRAKTMNGMRKQNENGTRLLHGRARVGETKSNHCYGQREAFWNKKILMPYTHLK